MYSSWLVDCIAVRYSRHAPRHVATEQGGTDMKKAFTLIELLVVMVIAVALMALAIPGFMSINRGAAMRGSARSVHSTASLARQWAITHRGNVSVQLSPSNALLVVDATEGTRLDEPLTFAKEISVSCFYFDTDSKTWIPTTNTEFLTTGGLKVDESKHEGDHKIELIGNGITNSVTINWLTGGISVK